MSRAAALKPTRQRKSLPGLARRDRRILRQVDVEDFAQRVAEQRDQNLSESASCDEPQRGA
jgi:hypothetical protein